MSDASRRDSKDESGLHTPGTDVAADLSTSDPSGAVPDRKVRVLCPYCGRGTLLAARCEQCKGLLDPLSRQATQNSMGPWFIHDPQSPFRPGCSYEVIREMVRRGKITEQTVLRGPNSRQYWMLASRTPAVANLLGKCHNCQHTVDASAVSCPSCGADFTPELDRQFMGLGPVHLLPGQAPAEEVARSAHQPPAAQRPRAAQEQPVASSSKAPLPRAAPPPSETGEYRALLNRMERLDRELGNTRVMLAIAALAVLVLAGGVLYFSGVFRSTSSPQDKWPTVEIPSGGAPSGSKNAEAEHGATPEDAPVDASMPPDPDQPAAPQTQPEEELDPPAPTPAPASPPEEDPKAAVQRAKAALLATQWAQLRGLP